MAIRKKSVYRRSFPLVLTFILLISSLLILSMILAYNFSTKKIENDFVSAKANVLEESISPYNNFFLNKLPEISYYNGYLDSASASKFVDTILYRYPFVKRVIFFDSEVRNRTYEIGGLNVGHFSIGMRNVYQYAANLPKDSIKIFDANTILTNHSLGAFNELAFKLYTFISRLDTTKMPSQDELFSNFSNIKANRIDYFNIPRFEDLKVYKQMITQQLPSQPVFQQDMLSFELDPTKIKILNIRPNLYQSIRIVPITYDPIESSSDFMTGEITLGGAFSSYKLYFTSATKFIKREVLSYFFPIAVAIFLFYGLLSLVAFLIFRNLNINQKMFKLQYDFLTNLSHEFKTPVSVIKIAGNNIKSAAQISSREQQMYGKILDEEADKLNGLMNKLLEFTQIENRTIKLNADRIDLVEFIESTIDAHLLKHTDFKLSFEVKDFRHFTSDPVLLGSLFDNLIDNAYKYSPVDRKILHIAVNRVKDKVQITFADAGIGIPAAEIKHVFKKFYRVQSEYNQTGSVGLGLAFCKELVNFMKGEITVQSELGKGTEFTILLPYVD